MSEGHYFTFGICRIFHWKNTLVSSTPHQNFAVASVSLPLDMSERVLLVPIFYGKCAAPLCAGLPAAGLLRVPGLRAMGGRHLLGPLPSAFDRAVFGLRRFAVAEHDDPT